MSKEIVHIFENAKNAPTQIYETIIFPVTFIIKLINMHIISSSKTANENPSVLKSLYGSIAKDKFSQENLYS